MEREFSKELRIGNLVNDYFNEVIKVDLVIISNVKKMKIKPIRVTKDWLHKFGFVPDKTFKNYYRLCDESDNPCFVVNYHGDFSECNLDGFNVKLRHIHKLQNLYFALTGQELTINE